MDLQKFYRKLLTKGRIERIESKDQPKRLSAKTVRNIKTASGMLGHFSASFTLDTYSHVTTSAQKEAAQTMGNVLSM